MPIRPQDLRFYRCDRPRQEDGREVADLNPWDLPGFPRLRSHSSVIEEHAWRANSRAQPRAAQQALQRMERGFCEPLVVAYSTLLEEHGGNTVPYGEAVDAAHEQMERTRNLGPVRYGPSTRCGCGKAVCLVGHPSAPYSPSDAPAELLRYL